MKYLQMAFIPFIIRLIIIIYSFKFSIKYLGIFLGIIIGIISSLISIVLLAGLYVWIKGNVIGNGLENWLKKLGVSSGIQLLDFSQMFTEIAVIFLVLGIGIGVFGSMLSMKKYLKV